MAIYEDIKLMNTKYTVYNNFNNYDDYILTFDYHGTPEELSTRKDVDKIHVNFISRYDTKFRFNSCDTEGIIYEIDGSCEKTRERVRIFKQYEDGYYEYHWCREVEMPFDTNFFKVGHPYRVRMNRTEEMEYMILIDKRFDRLIFVLGEHGKSTLYEVTDVKYRNQKKEYWYSAVLCEDTWSKDEKEEME